MNIDTAKSIRCEGVTKRVQACHDQNYLQGRQDKTL